MEKFNMKKLTINHLIIVLLCLVMLGVTAATPATAQNKKYKFAVIVHDGTTPFYAPVINGMNVACAQLGAECKFLGPPNGSDVAAEVDLAQNAINSGVDGIAIDIPDAKAMEKVVAEAKAKKVDIYFIGTPYPDHPEYGSIGQNFLNAGHTMGQQIVKYMPDGGKVGIVTCCIGNIQLGQRAQGAIDIMKANGKFTVVGPVDITSDATKQYGAIEAMYQANPDMKGIFGVDASTEVIARFIQKNNLKGKVSGGGFDLVQGTLNAIKTGDVQFTTGQNPFLWGYLSMHQLWLHSAHGVHPISLDSGADTVDISNVEGLDPMFH
jgi:simple sugar transport system substrate-binding protein